MRQSVPVHAARWCIRLGILAAALRPGPLSARGAHVRGAPHGAALVQADSGREETGDQPWRSSEPPRIIQTVPRLLPNGQYRHELKRIYQEAGRDFKRDTQIHISKLESQNQKLRRKVAALSEALSDEEAKKVEDEHELAKEKEREQRRTEVAAPTPALAKEYWASRLPAAEVAFYLICGATVLWMQYFTMTKSEELSVRTTFYNMTEHVWAIFIALLWYQAVNDFFEWADMSGGFVVLGAILNTVLIFAAWLAIAWWLCKKDKEDLLWTTTACGAHFVAFTAVHAGGMMQARLFSAHLLWCIVSLAVLLLLSVAISFLARFALKRPLESNKGIRSKFLEKLEELEDDVCGMLMAFAWTMTVRAVICGQYVPLEEGETGSITHTWWQRLIFLAYTLLISAVSLVALPYLQRATGQNQSTGWRYRVLLILQPFLTMCMSWAVLLWADWEIYEYWFRGKPVLGRVIFSLVATQIMGAVAYGVARYTTLPKEPAQEPTKVQNLEKALATTRAAGVERMAALEALEAELAAARRAQAALTKDSANDPSKYEIRQALLLTKRMTHLATRKFFLSMLAMVVAFSWEETLDQSIEAMVPGILMRFFVKLFTAVLLTASIMPVYVHYIRPHVEALEEEEDKLVGIHSNLIPQ